MVDLDFLHSAVDEGDFTDLDVLAEVKCLQAELEKARVVGTELEELYQAERARADMLKKVLPEVALLEGCGTALATMAGLYYSGNLKNTFRKQAQALLDAAWRIQEVRSETSK